MNNTSATIVSFIILTFFYSIIRFVLAGSSSEKAFTMIYFLLLLIMQYSVNVSNLQDRCGTIPHGSAIIFTIIPWLFIFGLLYVCLIIFPGWRAPFSNTFGYAMASVAGVKKLMMNDILEDENVLKSKNVKDLLDVREDIYTDPGLLINEITPDNFDKFWTKMKPIFRKTADEHKNALLKLVHLKEVVADFIWFVLGGAFTISVSYSNISSVPCQQTAEQMEEKHQDDIDNKQEDVKEKKKVYVSDD
jgi:hypothetical protein